MCTVHVMVGCQFASRGCGGDAVMASFPTLPVCMQVVSTVCFVVLTCLEDTYQTLCDKVEGIGNITYSGHQGLRKMIWAESTQRRRVDRLQIENMASQTQTRQSSKAGLAFCDFQVHVHTHFQCLLHQRLNTIDPVTAHTDVTSRGCRTMRWPGRVTSTPIKSCGSPMEN